MESNAELQQQLLLSKLSFSKSFFKSYRNTVIAFLLLVIAMRFLTKPDFSTAEFLMLMSHLLGFSGISVLHSYSSLGARVTPFLYTILSYTVHTKLIFSVQFDDPQDSHLVHMTKDMLFKHVIIFAALSVNLIYIGLFLTIHQTDTLIINAINWALFLKDTFQCPGLTFQSKSSCFLLAFFAFKFSFDAMKIKNQIFEILYQKDKSSKQWVDLFEKLPIGMLLFDGQKIVHSNEQMSKLTGNSGQRKTGKTKDLNDQIISATIEDDGHGLLDSKQNSEIITLGAEDMKDSKEIEITKQKTKVLPFRQFVAKLQNNKESQDTKLLINDKYINCLTQTVEFATQKMSILLFVDITQVQESEKEKLETKFKHIFLSSVSHNMKTPLNSLVMNHEILARRLVKKDLQSLQLIQRNQQTLSLMYLQIQDILVRLSQFFLNIDQAQEFEPNFEMFFLEVFLQDIRDLFFDQAQQKRLDVQLEISSKIKGAAHSLEMCQDKQRIMQVLANLISNAISFSKEGAIRITAEIMEDDENQIEIQVIDSGIGMNKAVNVGQMFQNLQVKENVNQSGIGFGLTISRLLMEKLEGTLTLIDNSQIKNEQIPQQPQSEQRQVNDNSHLFEDQNLSRQILLNQGVTATIKFPMQPRVESLSPVAERQACQAFQIQNENFQTSNQSSTEGDNANVPVETDEGPQFKRKLMSCMQTQLPKNPLTFLDYLSKTPSPKSSNRKQTKRKSSLPTQPIQNLLDKIKTPSFRQFEDHEELSKHPRGTYEKHFTLFQDKEEEKQLIEGENEPKRPCILVVDDNSFNVYSLQLLIKEFFNLESDVAYSGQEGINLVQLRVRNQEEPYKLILTDINMPGMDGLQMSKKIKQILNGSYYLLKVGDSTKIYAVTAMNDCQIKDNYKHFGIEEVIQKPLKADQIGSMISLAFDA